MVLAATLGVGCAHSAQTSVVGELRLYGSEPHVYGVVVSDDNTRYRLSGVERGTLNKLQKQRVRVTGQSGKASTGEAQITVSSIQAE
ncbi:hypothetical protein ACTSKR_12985 [Chitinibacteraceae bacterium HSL-7]